MKHTYYEMDNALIKIQNNENKRAYLKKIIKIEARSRKKEKL